MTLLVTPHGIDGNFNLDIERNLESGSSAHNHDAELR